MDPTNLHRVWKAILTCIAVAAAAVCVLLPVLTVGLALFLLLMLGGRFLYRGRDRYIPNLYSRDVRAFDEGYRAFIHNTISDLRQRRIPGHTLLQEASQLPQPADPDELLLDLGVWIGWSTRLMADASGRRVYGFDTFTGLVEDWAIDDLVVVEAGAFSLSDPWAQRFMQDSGLTLHDGVPSTLGRDVQFIKGSTYDTLIPFLADHPDAPIRLFHMDLDTYESCLHALETCKDRFVEGSILVFDEYLVTTGEMQAFFEFQRKYGLEWRYRAWGLEMMELNNAMVTSRWKRPVYYLGWIALHWLGDCGNYVWRWHDRRFWRFWLGAPLGDIRFMLGAAGQRKSVSLEITGLGLLASGDRAR